MALTSVDGPPARADRATHLLARIARGYEALHGVAVFDLEARARTARGVVLEGTVLLEGQRAAALEALEAAGLGPIEDRVVVLTATDGAPWVRPRRPLLAVLAAPDGDRATDVVPGDPPLRRLARRGSWWAVELADGTVGWSRGEDLEVLAQGEAPASVAEWRADYRGGFHSPAPGAWEIAARPWLGVPYLWGGTTRGGVDCSGLVQRLVRQVAGLGLPKHSADQMRSGRRIAPPEVAPGDLVYLTRRDTGVRHVALVVGRDPPRVVHAGLDAGVTIEALEALADRYELRGAARIGPPPGA